jgi:hypothetical protein
VCIVVGTHKTGSLHCSPGCPATVLVAPRNDLAHHFCRCPSRKEGRCACIAGRSRCSGHNQAGEKCGCLLPFGQEVCLSFPLSLGPAASCVHHVPEQSYRSHAYHSRWKQQQQGNGRKRVRITVLQSGIQRNKNVGGAGSGSWTNAWNNGGENGAKTFSVA